jgi:hypothetical protein
MNSKKQNPFHASSCFAILSASLVFFACGGELPKASVPGAFDPDSLDSVTVAESYGIAADGNFNIVDSVRASVETYLKYAEAVGSGPTGGNSFDDNLNGLSGNISALINQKLDKIIETNVANPPGTSSPTEIIDRILDKGAVTTSHFYTKNCNVNQLKALVDEDGSGILTYLNTVVSPVLQENMSAEGLDRVLDKGFVIDIRIAGTGICEVSHRTVVASVETYLKYAEAVGLTGGGGGAVPAYAPQAKTYMIAKKAKNSCTKKS